MLKLISWNVNGLRAIVNKNFEAEFRALDADFFCLQETKLQAGQLELQFDGYEAFWNYAEKKAIPGRRSLQRKSRKMYFTGSATRITTARGACSRSNIPNTL